MAYDENVTLESFPSPSEPDRLLTIAYNKERRDEGYAVTFISDSGQIWVKDGLPAKFSVDEANVKGILEEGEARLSLVTQLVSQCKNEIRELEAKVKQQETEIRTLKRQLSLTTPIETSPSKAQAQAAASLKGKSILNPRVKKAKQKRGIFFEEDSDEEADAEQTQT